jgi:hypothetical protein
MPRSREIKTQNRPLSVCADLGMIVKTHLNNTEPMPLPGSYFGCPTNSPDKSSVYQWSL